MAAREAMDDGGFEDEEQGTAHGAEAFEGVAAAAQNAGLPAPAGLAAAPAPAPLLGMWRCLDGTHEAGCTRCAVAAAHRHKKGTTGFRASHTPSPGASPRPRRTRRSGAAGGAAWRAAPWGRRPAAEQPPHAPGPRPVQVRARGRGWQEERCEHGTRLRGRSIPAGWAARGVRTGCGAQNRLTRPTRARPRRREEAAKSSGVVCGMELGAREGCAVAAKALRAPVPRSRPPPPATCAVAARAAGMPDLVRSAAPRVGGALP